MRVLVDANLPASIVEFLNQLGHDAVWSGTLIPTTSPDDHVVARAIQDSRVILTMDLDFSKIIQKSRLNEPSLITLRLPEWPMPLIHQALTKNLPSLEQTVLEGVMITIDENGPRIHPLRPA